MRDNRKRVIALLHFALCVLLIIIVSGCGDAIHTSSETGSIAFSVEWKGAPTIQACNASIRAASLDCEAAGVSTVKGEVYDENNVFLGGDERDCEAHQGRITGVPVGSNRKLVVLGEDSNGNALYRGEKSGITVSAGQTTNVGSITVEPITPPTATITSPSDGSTYTEGDSIAFGGSGSDTEDGNLTGDSLVWTSDIGGQIGTGTSFSCNDLSLGIHTITLTVTDSDGATGTDSITVTVTKIVYETEPNNDMDHAYSLLSYTSIIGQLSSDSDEDWFSISTSGATLITANFYAEESYYWYDDWSISIEDASGNVLAQTDCCAGTDEEAEFYAAVTEAGTYYIIVTADYQYSGDNYTPTLHKKLENYYSSITQPFATYRENAADLGGPRDWRSLSGSILPEDG